MPGQKRLFVKTFGCQMNAYDSERMADALLPFGFVAADGPDDADVIILNTCHIREKAAEKVYSELGRIRKIKVARQQSGAETQVVVAGCVAQAEGAEIIRRAPVVDLVVGPQNYHRLPDLLFRARQEGRHLVDTEFADESKFASLPKRSLSRTCSAFLTIQEGCDKFCTFCVVPYTRGMEFSRPVSQILDEAKTLIDGGVCEITLLGQNVNAYHGHDEAGRNCTLAGLIERLSAIEGIERLRYTTSHPSDMSDDLIEAHGSNIKLMPYLHLPFQSGSDRMLAAMNRRHTRQHYLDIIAKIRAVRPDIALSTDIIVGFPGESEEDFLETLDVVREVNFAQAYSFKFSARPGTPAAGLPEQVVDAIKSARLGQLQSLLGDQQKQFNTKCVGATLPVLFEKIGRHDGQLVGRSPYLQPVHAKGIETLIGQLHDVEIQAAGPNSLSGVIIQASQAGMQVHSGV